MEGDKKIWQDRQFILGVILGLAAILAVALVVFAFKFYSNQAPINSVAKQADTEAQTETQAPVASKVETESITNPAINTFELKKTSKICQDGGLPVVYLFSTASCPHCQWIKATYGKVVLEYVKAGKIKAHHYDLETGDDLLTTATETQLPAGDLAIYQEFNPDDSIPTFVFGCKYFRIGNGYENEANLANEEKEFRAIIEDLIKK